MNSTTACTVFFPHVECRKAAQNIEIGQNFLSLIKTKHIRFRLVSFAQRSRRRPNITPPPNEVICKLVFTEFH